jgi:hypothetical protein
MPRVDQPPMRQMREHSRGDGPADHPVRHGEVDRVGRRGHTGCHHIGKPGYGDIA